MLDFMLDATLCAKCGACIAACGRNVLADDGKGAPRIPPGNESKCNRCGHCSAICPVNALVSPGSGGERAMPIDFGPPLDFASARRLILSCRSIRRYNEEQVTEEELLELLDIARRAPTASNLQPVRWMAIKSREKAERFTALTMDWFNTVVRYDHSMQGRYNIDDMVERYRAGHDPILRGATNVVFALTDKSTVWGQTDAAIAMTYFCLAAHARNIGSCWCGFGILALKTYAPLRKFLGLGQDELVQAMAFLGRSDMVYHSLPPRKPLQLTWI